MVTQRIENELQIPVHDVTLEGELIIPKDAKGLVVFSHGSGSSRNSPRNNYVAETLHERKIGSLLFDLLTYEEDADYSNRFNIDLLTKRLVAVTQWLIKQEAVDDLPFGYFGASTGAASALRAATSSKEIQAMVSRGGRPDLAMQVLDKVEAPTLLIVGGLDFQVIELNEEAYDKLQCKKQLEIVDGATHLFEEPGKLEEAARLAGEWFEQHF